MNIEQERNDPKNISLVKNMIRQDIIKKMNETFNCDASYQEGTYFAYIAVPLYYQMVTKEQIQKVSDLGIDYWFDFRDKEKPTIIIPLDG